jgi:hypothetical protein
MKLYFHVKHRNIMTFHQYKDCEDELVVRFTRLGLKVKVEPVDSADIYYTDGEAQSSVCKLMFAFGKTVYVPQLNNVNPEHKKIIEDWIEYVKSNGQEG